MTITETPLTSDQYTTLRRGRHRTKWMVVANPNQVMFKARINQATFTSSFAQVTFDGVTVGSFSNVKVGWTVFVSATDDIKAAFFRGRVRKAPTSSILYINQTSSAFADNFYIFIIKDTALHERLPYKEGSVILEDRDKTYNQIDPTITNLPSFVVARLTDIGYVDIPFAATARANTSGRTISSHSWDSDGGTYASGSSSVSNPTIRFSAPGWYEVRDTVTDSAGQTNFFAVRVIVYPADYSEVIAKDLICDTLTCEMSVGWGAQIRAAAGDDVVELLNETEIVVFSEDWFAGQRGSLITNAKFIGRLRKTNNSTGFALQNNAVRITKQTQVEVEGIGAQLGRLILASVTLRRRDPASVLGEIKDLTLWRGMQFLAQLTTLSTIHALDFDSTNNDYLYPLFTAQDRSAESALSDTAFTINAYFNWNPQGQIKIARHMWFLNSTDKAALTTIANFTKRDYGGVQLVRDRVPRLGRVIAYGGTYNSASGTTLALRAKAPSVVWGPGEGRSQLNRQVLKANLTLAQAQAEMIVRTGAEYSSKNLVNTLEIKFPSGYDNVLSPSVYLCYTWDIEASSNREGFACDEEKIWWLERINVRYKPFDGMDGGRTETTGSFVEDVTSANAQIIAEIAPDDRPAPVPSFPLDFDTPFWGLPGLQFVNGPDIDPDDEQPYTPKDAEATQKPPKKSTDPEKPAPTPAQHAPSRAGSVVAIANSSSLWLCEDFNLKSAPSWRNITPGSGIADFRFDPYSGGAYALTNDGSNSFVWRCDNALNPSWRSTSIQGVYTQIRATGTGGVIIYSPSAPLSSCNDASMFFSGTVTSQVGMVYEVESVGFSLGWGDLADGAPCCTLDHFVVLSGFVTTGTMIGCDGTSLSFGSLPQSIRYLDMGSGAGEFKVRFTFTGGDTDINAANIRISTNAGATFDEPIEVGDETSVEAAFAYGASMWATADGQVRYYDGAFIDTPGGETPGTYAHALWPYDGGGVLMAPASVLSGDTLFVVDGTATAISPTDGVNKGLIVGQNGVVSAGVNAIFAVGNFGGTIKFARSSDAGVSWDVSLLDSAAKAVRTKNADQVYVTNGNAVLYSEDGGATLVSKITPTSSLILVEVR